MADSAFLSRLPVRGAAAASSGPSDAFKVPLLNADGKLDSSLLADKVIYEVENQAALLALPNLSVGAIALEKDTKALVVLTTLPSNVYSNWSSLGTGINFPVTRVAGKTGDITLNVSDISGLSTTLSGLQPAGSYALNTDSRFSDSRTPTAHASTHATGGTDPITPNSIGAANKTHTHTVEQITNFPVLGSASGLNAPIIGDATPTEVVLGNDSRLSAVSNKIDSSRIGQANGVASLDSTGKVPTSQLPYTAGGNGKEVSLQVSGGYIQWQYAGDATWTNLVSLSSLTGGQGSAGASVNLQIANGYIQWQHVGDNTWNNLISVTSLAGQAGSPGGKGDKGDKGDQGLPGTAATISVGTTTTGSSGASAQVTNVGTQNSAVLDFTIPRGLPGLDGAFELDNEGNLIPTAGPNVTWGINEGTFHLDEDGDLTPSEIIVSHTSGGGTVGYISTATTDDATPTILNYGANNSPDIIVEGQAITFEAQIIGHNRSYDTVSSWQITGGVQVKFDGTIQYFGGQPSIIQNGNSWGLNAVVAFSVDSSFLPQITVTGISGTKISWGATLTIKNTEQAIQVPLIRGCKIRGADNYNPLADEDDGSCTFNNSTSEMYIPITSSAAISSLTVESGGESMFPAFSTNISDYAIKTHSTPGNYVQATVTINGTAQTIYGQIDKLFQIKDSVNNYYVRFLNSQISSSVPQIRYGPLAAPGESVPPAGYWLYTGGYNGSGYYIVADENGVPNWYILSSLGSSANSLHPGGDKNRMAGNDWGGQREIIELKYGQPEVRIVNATLGYPDGHEVEELVGPVFDPHDGSNRKLHVLLELDGTDVPGFKLEEQDQNGNVTWSWLSGDWFNDTSNDSFHINSIDVHPVTGNIVISSRHMSCLFEIDYGTKKVNWVIQGQYPGTQPFTAYAKQSTINTAKILNIVGEPSGWYGTSGNHDARYHVGLINTNNIIISAYDDGSFAPVPYARGVIYEINLAQNTATCLSSTMLNEQGTDYCCGSYRIVKNPDGSVSHCFGSANFDPAAIEYVGSPTSSVRTKVYSWYPGYGMYRCVKVGREQFDASILRTCWTQTTQPPAYNPPGGGGETNTLGNGLQGYWNLNDTSWTDATTNNNDLTVVGSPTVVPGGLGSSNAAQLTSGSDYLKFPAGLFDTGSNPISVSMWFKLNQTAVGYQWLLCQGYPADYHNWMPCYVEANGQLSFLVAPEGGGWEQGLGTYGITPEANQWYHYVVTLDGNLVTMYLNGNQVNIFNYSSPIDATGSQFALGAYPAFDGSIASGLTNLFERVGLWNRALTTAEVTALYAGGAGLSYPFTPPTTNTLLNGVQAYWKLDDNGSGGVSLEDSTVNSRTLSAPNGTSGLTLGAGKIAGAASFNSGGNTYLSTSGEFLSPNGAQQGEYSVSCWVKTTNDIFIVETVTGSNWAGGSIALDLNNGQIFPSVWWGGYPNSSFDRFGSGADLRDGEWHHLAFTWKYNGSLIAYVDGAETGRIASSGNLANVNVNNVSLNSNSDGTYLVGQAGQIDEVGIWTRALTQAEVTSLYNSGSGLAYPFTAPTNTLLNGVQAYWKLDDNGSGDVSLADSTGNGNSLANPNNALQVVGKIDGGAGFGNGNQNNLITESGSRLPSEATWGSVSCWFNAAALTNGVIFGDYYRNTLFLGVNNSVLIAGLGNDGGGATQVSISVLTNTWYHAVVTYNGTAFSLYLNNNLIDTVQVDWSGQIWQPAGFSLGSTGDNFGGNYQFNGTIDEVGIWNRALTTAEVTSLYASGYGITYPFKANSITQEGLVTWLDAQSLVSYPGAGSTWFDLTSNQVDGTLIDGITFGTVAGANAFTTDGSSGYISLGGVPNFGVSNQSLSIGVWVNPASGNGNIVGESATDPLISWYMPPITAVGNEFDGVIYNQINYGADMFSGIYNQNSWYYVTLVYDQSTTSKLLYVNGYLVGIENIGGSHGPDTAGNSNPYIFLGRDMVAAVYNAGWFQGSYGALHLYSDKALNSTEVLFNYNSTKASYGL